jgi:hypothetical protein
MATRAPFIYLYMSLLSIPSILRWACGGHASIRTPFNRTAPIIPSVGQASPSRRNTQSEGIADAVVGRPSPIDPSKTVALQSTKSCSCASAPFVEMTSLERARHRHRYSIFPVASFSTSAVNPDYIAPDSYVIYDRGAAFPSPPPGLGDLRSRISGYL